MFFPSEQKKEKKKSKSKRKQIKLPTLSVNRGIFENVLLGKTCHRETYSPLQKARMNEDIFALAQNRPNQEDFSLMNINIAGENTALKDTELIDQKKENSLPPCTSEQNSHKNDGLNAEREKSESDRREMPLLNYVCHNDTRATKKTVQEDKEPYCHVGRSDKQLEFFSNKKSFDVLNFDFLAKNSSSGSDDSDSHLFFRKKVNHDIFLPEKYTLNNKINYNQTNRYTSENILQHSYTPNKKFKFFNPHTFPDKKRKKSYRLSPHTY
ncbi:uncharacterized protein LOC106661318 isoform X2 [Cimex lectularius]|uniref:Uncharacterized protein n=1 Tax=Cimex lectularius TaxID=79782 RepID=A0A8I6RAA1_CIMLE|nr:uncharacterized protein LOC106661318 isoform X2 [Cimex lectularius]